MATPLFLSTLVVQTTATLFLFLVFLVLFRHSRRLYFVYWTAGWFVLGLGLLALSLLVGLAPAEPARSLLLSVRQSSTGFATLLVFFATRAFVTGRAVRPWAWSLFALPAAYFALSAGGPSALAWASTTPRHLLFAVSLWTSGALFYRLGRRERKVGAGLLAASFALWGLQQAHYAAVYFISGWQAPHLEWVGFLDTVIVVLVSLGMIRFALDEDRSQLLDSTRKLEISEQRLQDLAMRDPLTGLFNRRHFEQVAPQIEAQVLRLSFPVAVAVVDLNYFKETNDRDGHQRGDQILCAFAEFLRRETRSADLPFRWGGDEFLLLMVDLSGADVADKAEQLRAGWERVRHQLGTDVSLAMGWSLLEEDGLEAAIRRADRRMYGDKRARRRAGAAQT
ncbi:MAG: GGDEF domain-containing protein [Gemmatimonadota bacterium]